MQAPPTIAINTRLLVKGKTEGIARFAIEILKRWVLLWPNTTFYFLFDRKPSKAFLFADNVKAVVLAPMARHPLLYYLWFHIAIKRWLKNNGNPIFFSPEGYLSLFYKGLQFNVIHDLNFEEFPQYLPKAERYYYKTFFPKYAHISQHIFTVSEFSKYSIQEKYGIASHKISVAYNSVSFNTNKHIEINTKAVPFLLYVGSLHPRKNLKTLVEAFLKFKNQETDSQLELHIVGLKMWSNEAWQKKLSEKNNGIQLLGRLDDALLQEKYSNAKAFIYPSVYEGFGLPIIEAQFFNCPVICANNSALPEIAGDSTLLFDANNSDELAEKIKLLVQNQSIREELIAKGKANIKRFSWQKSAEHIAKTIATTYAKSLL